MKISARQLLQSFLQLHPLFSAYILVNAEPPTRHVHDYRNQRYGDSFSTGDLLKRNEKCRANDAQT